MDLKAAAGDLTRDGGRRMRREELLPVIIECNVGASTLGFVQRDRVKVYNVDEVDQLLDEKDAEIRRLRRALYKACANWADVEVFERTVGIDDPNVEANRWALMRNKCLKKVEEYK